MTTQPFSKAHRALLAALVLALPCTVLADPPSEDVLRPDVPSTVGIYVEPYLGINYAMFNPNASAWEDETIRALYAIEGETDIYNSAQGIAPRFGLNVGIQFSERFALELGLGYDMYRGSNSGRTVDVCTIEDLTTGAVIQSQEEVDKKYTVGVDHVTFSAAAAFNFNSVFLTLGPVVGVGVNQLWDESWHVVSDETECRYFFNTPDTTRDVMGEFTDDVSADLRFALRAGIGTVIEISKGIALVPRIAFEFGLTDAFKSAGEPLSETEIVVSNPDGPTGQSVTMAFNEAIRVHAVQISLGLRFM